MELMFLQKTQHYYYQPISSSQVKHLKQVISQTFEADTWHVTLTCSSCAPQCLRDVWGQNGNSSGWNWSAFSHLILVLMCVPPIDSEWRDTWAAEHRHSSRTGFCRLPLLQPVHHEWVTHKHRLSAIWAVNDLGVSPQQHDSHHLLRMT